VGIWVSPQPGDAEPTTSLHPDVVVAVAVVSLVSKVVGCILCHGE
jgi:hypothetical protein